MTDDGSRIARLEVAVAHLREDIQHMRNEWMEMAREQGTLRERQAINIERITTVHDTLQELVHQLAAERAERRREAFTSGWQRMVLIAAVVIGILSPIVSILEATRVLGP